jgi:hypothetical protein
MPALMPCSRDSTDSTGNRAATGAEFIAWLLDRGFTVDQIGASLTQMMLPANRVMGDDGSYVSMREMSQQTGIDLELLEQLMRAAGLPRTEDPDAAVVPRADAEAAAHAKYPLPSPACSCGISPVKLRDMHMPSSWMGQPASAHRDSHCQAVHRTWARSSGDVAHAGAAHQRISQHRCSTTNLGVGRLAAQPSPSSRSLGTRNLRCSLLVKSSTDTFRRIRPERSRPTKGPTGAVDCGGGWWNEEHLHKFSKRCHIDISGLTGAVQIVSCLGSSGPLPAPLREIRAEPVRNGNSPAEFSITTVGSEASQRS